MVLPYDHIQHSFHLVSRISNLSQLWYRLNISGLAMFGLVKQVQSSNLWLSGHHLDLHWGEHGATGGTWNSNGDKDMGLHVDTPRCESSVECQVNGVLTQKFIKYHCITWRQNGTIFDCPCVCCWSAFFCADKNNLL